MMRTVWIASLVALALVACGSPSSAPPASGNGDGASPDAEQKYRATGFVLDEPDMGPELCLGGVDQSMPPQCDGIPLKGWDWEGVDGEESAVKTTWGSYEVTGRFEGERFVVLEAGPPPSPPEDDKDHFKSPCAVSDDDWERPDPEMATDRDQVRAINAAEKEPDFAAAWIDYIDPPTEFMDPGNVILNAAFTGDLQTHEEDLREFWGGPLCVSQLERPYKELIRIQKELNGEIPPSNFLGSSVDVVLNRVELQVARMTEDELEEIEERYGEGTVAIEVRLQPVD